MILAFAAVLYSVAAFAQTDKPMVGNKLLVQIKPKAAAAKPEAAAPKGKAQSTALQACLDIDDRTKDRLDCYDAVIPPAPKPRAPKVKGVADCRFLKEEDERLACFNGFAESLSKLPKT
jgi:hypothetical protein